MVLGLSGLVLWVRDAAAARAFYVQTLGLSGEGDQVRVPGGVTFFLQEGRGTCHARGPHGVVPALHVPDLAAAKGWLERVGCPIVFEEVVPGLARLTCLDPDGNAVDLAELRAPRTWRRGERVLARPDVSQPPSPQGLLEISLYAPDTGAALTFCRQVLALETGVAYFAHVHLLLGDLPLVIRPTWQRCTRPEAHTPGLVLDVRDAQVLVERCQAHGHRVTPDRLVGRPVWTCHGPAHTRLYWPRPSHRPG